MRFWDFSHISIVKNISVTGGMNYGIRHAHPQNTRQQYYGRL